MTNNLTTTIKQKIKDALEIGDYSSEGFEAEIESDIAYGGWINIAVVLSVRGVEIGGAYVGAFIFTDADTSTEQNIIDECKLVGFAIRPYKGKRSLTVTTGDSWKELFGLTDEEVEACGEDMSMIECILLDLVDDHIEGLNTYEDLFTEALRYKLSETDGYEIYALMRAVRALEGHDA